MSTRSSSLPTELRLSFAAKRLAPLAGAQQALTLIWIGALVFTGWCWVESQELEKSAVQYEAAVVRQKEINQEYLREAQRKGLTLSHAQLATIDQEITFAGQLVEKRAFSWVELLHNLEESVPPNVSLGSVRLNFQDSLVSLHGTSRSLQDINEFVHRLEQHAVFSKASLESHKVEQRVATGIAEGHAGPSPRQGVGFTLRVVYKPKF